MTKELSDDVNDYLYKVLVVGDLATGKTSMIKRYVHGIFSRQYKATIGVDFALKVMNVNEKTIVRLQLWDIAGQERYGNMTRVYYKEAAGAFVVFDVTRPETFEGVKKWKQDIDSKVFLPNKKPIPVVLLANKVDLKPDGWGQTTQQMDEFCKEHRFCGWFPTSAKENLNIGTAAKFLVNQILNENISQAPQEEDVVDLTKNTNEIKKKGCC
ncbi:ras-related protein rab-32 [Anaeramoeba ignava]|uniref:Ras-related protein Rab n=1 Tax=Anaeramoeba ignava TaxID=1746090 RepID=A0A9Q0LEE9_ANAIG|nr:ras-related protein rab-32 [Anaeramoeba ignava]|eukprot:Anaeramoba_ignava/c19693_g2_i1.p1 GENE.c19693_g2_i1~~c19693_g2_i1.p1  ORF type:complete len:212 (-),score=67.31 c19693_g2_i1:93-728(-)